MRTFFEVSMYRLHPSVTISSCKNTLVFQNDSGELFDVHLDSGLHLTLIQVLLCNNPVSEEATDTQNRELFDVLSQLKDLGLIVETSEHDSAEELPISDFQSIRCYGERALQVARALAKSPCFAKPIPLELILSDSPSLLPASLTSHSERSGFAALVVVECSVAEIIISPDIGSASGRDVFDWVTRRKAASWWPEQLSISWSHSFKLGQSHLRFPKSQLDALCECISKDLIGSPFELRISKSGEISKSFVAKVPKICVPAKPKEASFQSIETSRLDLDQLLLGLVSKHTGIIRELDHLSPQPWWPAGFHIVESKISDIETVLGWPADRIAAGASWDEKEGAIFAALGEAVERYSGNAIPETGFEKGSFHTLIEQNLPALNPEHFALFSNGQYDAEGFPFVPFGKDTLAKWVWGRSLLTGDACLAPAQLTYVNWYYVQDASSPTNVTMFAGIAAGPSRQFAEISALEEIIERDAVHIWWHGKLPAKRLEVPATSKVAKSLVSLDENWQYSLLSIPSPTGVPVVGCLLYYKPEQLLSLGIAARLDAESAALKALAEAIQLHDYARGLLDEDGVIWQAVRDRTITGRNLKPVREDRRYLDSYRADFHDVVDLPCQMQVYLDPRSLGFVEELWQPKLQEKAADISLNAESQAQHHALLLKLVSQQTEGNDILSVDLTTADIAEIGLSVVRVLAPGMYSNSPTAFPYFGGKRLKQEVTKHHGIDKDWEQNLRLEPPPYA